MGAPVNIVEPLRRVEHRRMIFPNLQKKLPMLARNIKINETIAARKNLCRRHRAMLAAGAFEDLLVVGPEANDMLLSRQRLLHRAIDMIAFSGALAAIKGRQNAYRGKQA